MEEIWKAITDFEGFYEVSNLGNVRGCQRIRKSKAESISVVQGKTLHPKSDKDGYKEVALCKDGKMYFKRVHRLVASAFIPNPNNYPVINHIDENPSNNCVSNLEWCSISYNNKYSVHKRSQKVICNGVEFPSIKALARHLNVDSKALRYRLKVGGLYKGKFKITIS